MDYTVLVALCAAAAYLFCDRWQVTKMRIAREDGNRFYLRVALWAGVLFTCGWLLHRGCLSELPRLYKPLVEILQNAVSDVSKPDQASLSLTHACAAVIWALVLAALGPYLLNMPMSNPDLSYAFMLRIAPSMQFELLLLDANRAGAELPIQITLTSGKFYVGLVLSSPSPDSARSWFKILPLMSGYSDEKKQLQPTTFYLSVYDTVLRARATGGIRSLLDFELLVPAADVQWARLFDIQIYLTEFKKLGGSAPNEKEPGTPLDVALFQGAIEQDRRERENARTSSERRIAYLSGLGFVPVALVLWAAGLAIPAIVALCLSAGLGTLSGLKAKRAAAQAG